MLFLVFLDGAYAAPLLLPVTSHADIFLRIRCDGILLWSQSYLLDGLILHQVVIKAVVEAVDLGR